MSIYFLNHFQSTSTRTYPLKSVSRLVGVGILTLTFALTSCSVGHTHGEDLSNEAPEAASTEKEALYTCSMHPQIKQPHPGSCPICGMALIPLEHDDDVGGHDGVISFSENAKRLAKIETTPVVRAIAEKEVRLLGKLELDETRIRTVASRFPGRVERLYIDYVGVNVSKEDHLAEMFSPFLLNAQTELLNAKRYDSQGLSLSGAREKLRLLGMTDRTIQELEERGTASDRLQINAPTSGVVIEKKVNEGDYVETGTTLFRVAEMDRLWLMLEAYESDLAWLRFGQKVHFTVKSSPGKEFEGTIAFIQPALDPNARTIKVRVNIDNPDRLLKPGMYAKGVVHVQLAGGGEVVAPELAGKWISPMHPEIVKDHAGACDICGMALVRAEDLGYAYSQEMDAHEKKILPLLIPSSSLLRTGKRALVYVEVPNSERPAYEPREVVLGPQAGELHIIQSGLEEGEQVVSRGAFRIDSSLQIQGKRSMMSSKEYPGQDEHAPHDHPHESHAQTRDPHSSGNTNHPYSNLPQHEPYEGFYKQFDPLLEEYFKMQQALAKDNLTEAQIAAKAMVPHLSKIQEPFQGKAPITLIPIIEATDLVSARKSFEPLSQWVIESVQQYGTSLDTKIWKMSCPMVFGHTAYWLQNHDKLLNSFHGSSMLHCGDNEGLVYEQTQQEK